MIFYHGSNQIIQKPIAHGSNYENDYGPSFYTTLDLDLAKEWACKDSIAGVVNKYQMRNNDYGSLKILDLTDKNEFSVLNWLSILVHFRRLDPSFRNLYQQALQWLEKYYIDVDRFDIIKGYRADDSYFEFPLNFISGQLSLEDLQEVFELGNLGIQYAIMSERAIKKLVFLSSIPIDENFIGKHEERVKQATTEFKTISSKPIDYSKTYIKDLMNKDVGLLQLH